MMNGQRAKVRTSVGAVFARLGTIYGFQFPTLDSFFELCCGECTGVVDAMFIRKLIRPCMRRGESSTRNAWVFPSYLNL